MKVQKTPRYRQHKEKLKMMKQAREKVFSRTPKSVKNQNDYGGGIIQFFIENGGTCCNSCIVV